MVRGGLESLAERAFHPIALASPAALLVAEDVEVRFNRLGDKVAAAEMAFLEPHAARTVDSLEGLGVDGGEVCAGTYGQVLAESAAEANSAGKA